MLAHIHNGTIVARYASPNVRVDFGDGHTVSPIVIGYTYGEHRIVPLVEETVDTSTGTDTVTTRETLVEADRVLMRTTIRDVTQAEIDQRAADRDARELRLSEDYGIIRALTRAALDQENRIRVLEGRSELTAEQFRDWIKSQL